MTPEDVLILLFARSDASRAAGRAYLARWGARQKDRDTPATSKAIQAQLAATQGWAASDAGRYSYLSRIKQPVLVADGEWDVVMPTINSRTLAGKLPNARLMIYPDSAHGFLFQYPDDFVKDVSTFLRRR
jgi:pimeloyl-ACP methyl ester carboxylesterase